MFCIVVSEKLVPSWENVYLPQSMHKILFTKTGNPFLFFQRHINLLYGFNNRNKIGFGKMISSCQSGFMSGRSIGNTCLIYAVICYTNKRNIPCLVMLTEFQKAFDSVSWPCLKPTLIFFFWWWWGR